MGVNARVSGLSAYGHPNIYGRQPINAVNRPGQIVASPSSPALFNGIQGFQVGQASRPIQQMQNQTSAVQQPPRQEEGSQLIKNESFFMASKADHLKKQHERSTSEAQFIGQSKGFINQQRNQATLFGTASGVPGGNAGIARQEGILKTSNTSNILAKPGENIDQKPVIGQLSPQQSISPSPASSSVSVSASTTTPPSSISTSTRRKSLF